MKVIKLKWEVTPQQADKAKGFLYEAMTPFGGYYFSVVNFDDGKKGRVLRKHGSPYQHPSDINTFEDAAESCQKDFQEYIERGFEYVEKHGGLSSFDWHIGIRMEQHLIQTPLGFLEIENKGNCFYPSSFVGGEPWGIDIPYFSSLDAAKNWCSSEFVKRLYSSIDKK